MVRICTIVGCLMLSAACREAQPPIRLAPCEAGDAGMSPGYHTEATTSVERLNPLRHPPGTVLRDTHRELWMVENWLERRHIANVDELDTIGLDEHDAIAMSEEEAECLIAIRLEEWSPPLDGWRAAVAPGDEGGVYLVNEARGLRRFASTEALYSWNFPPWTDAYAGGESAWTRLREVNPLGFRDGSLFLTERGRYYHMIRNEAWSLSPTLAEQAGLDLAEANRVFHDRLFRQTSYAGELTREHFLACPAELVVGAYPDRDEDGSPTARDCNDDDPAISPLVDEACNGVDDNCDGLVDDAEDCFS